MHKRLRQTLCLAFFVTSLVGTGPAAGAHTALEASTPKDGARVNAPPGQIELDFTEPIRTQLTRVSVRGPGGERFESGGPQSATDKVTQPLRPLGAAGGYEILYRVVAIDGHPLVGTVRFTLTQPGPAASGKAAATYTGTPTAAADNSDDDGAGGVSPLLLVVIAVAVVAFIAGAIWFGRSVTRDVD